MDLTVFSQEKNSHAAPKIDEVKGTITNMQAHLMVDNEQHSVVPRQMLIMGILDMKVRPGIVTLSIAQSQAFGVLPHFTDLLRW